MHWVGIVIDQRGSWLTVKYFDSENQVIPLSLDMLVSEIFEANNLEHPIKFEQIRVEQQRYNNCGPEVIENFVLCLTGVRATQEAAVVLHSLLLENTLLDPDYKLKIEENNKLIGLFSNTAPLPMYEAVKVADGPVPTPTHLSVGKYYSLTTLVVNNQVDGSDAVGNFVFMEYLVNLAGELNNKVSNAANTVLGAVINNDYARTKILGYIYDEEVAEVRNVLGKEYVKTLTDDRMQRVFEKHPLSWDKKDFKLMKLAFHPDKGGKGADFRIINEFEELVGKKEVVYENARNKLAEKLLPTIQKVSIYSKGADIGIDLAKMYLEPNLKHSLDTAYDGVVLYNKLLPNVFGALIVVITTPITSLYNLYQGEFEKAGIQAINGLSYYMLNSKFLPHHGIPAFAGLNGLTIAYDFYKGEYIEVVMQALGVFGMIVAPSATVALYALKYTYNNVQELYRLYQEGEQKNTLKSSKLIINSLERDIWQEDIVIMYNEYSNDNDRVVLEERSLIDLQNNKQDALHDLDIDQHPEIAEDL